MSGWVDDGDSHVVAVLAKLTNVEKLKSELSDKLAISTVAERLGAETQASGDQWRCLCLLHSENTPSMYLRDSKGVYHCFGCQQGGDAIDLVQKVRHLSFPEALYWLAAEADIDITAYERPLTEQEKQQEEFRSWCEAWLSGSTAAPPSRIDPEAAQLYGVVNLTQPSTGRRPSYFDEKQYLLDGVILPWRTPSGKLVGWRVREYEGEKRVIGTPNDFPLGRINDETLFGIQVAREHITDGTLIVVEGEYDVLALWAAGIKNVVAMGGSSLTEGQMKLIESLHIREIVVLFDGDEGGRRSAHALAQKHWASDSAFVRVAVCPEGQDPEDLTKEGSLSVWLLVQTAPAALEHLLRQEWSRKARSSLSEKLEFVQWIRDSYGAKLRSTDESLVLGEVARWLEIPELEVRDYVRAADGSLCAQDSERLLLGRACRDRNFYLHLRETLDREDFFVMKHQRLWDILANMLIDGQEFDAPTIESRAVGQGIPEGYIAGCLELPDANWEHHLKVVADLSLRRRTRDDALSFRDKIQDLQQPADVLVGDLTYRITSKALRQSGVKQKQLSEQVDEAMDTLHERMRNPSEIHGIDLGSQFPRLSRTLQGLQPKRLVLVAALSRLGKSTALAQWAASVGVYQSVPVDFISLEMDQTEILYKIASHITAIDSMKISGGRLEGPEVQAVEQAMLRIRNSALHIWAPDGLTGNEFLLYARESVMQRRTQAFFVDYVQLVDPESHQQRDNGYKLYGDFGRLCKMKVARAMGVTVICAAQMRRDVAGKDRPTAEDIGDSYAIVRHSDVMLILHGEEDSPTLNLWIDKNRQGSGGGLVPLVYDKPTQTMREASGGAKLPDYVIRA